MMKKIIAVCLVFVLVLSLAACRQEKGQYFFTAKVIEVHEEYLLLEVYDTGNSHLSDGAKVEVSTDVVSADGCPEFVINEYARILLARHIGHNPPGRLEALAIYKTAPLKSRGAQIVEKLGLCTGAGAPKASPWGEAVKNLFDF